jgi:hypothetical protein
MTGLTVGKATLCIVNYRTLELTRLCLRSVRRYTDYPNETLVIDNGSSDASLDYLRGLPWITLVERHPAVPDASGAHAHGAALDLGLSLCRTEYFVAMHSDAVVLSRGWLSELTGYLRRSAKAASAGADKIELRPAWQVLLKKATDLNALHRRLFGDADTVRRYRPFNRTICSVYRTEVLIKERLSFAPDAGRRLTVGQAMHFELQDRGYETVQVPARVMRGFVIHLAHGTQVVNTAEFGYGQRSAGRWHKTLEHCLARGSIQAILGDESLDR